MTTNKEFSFTKDIENKKVIVVREFDAPLEDVWDAWTQSELLDQWWAPKPWKAETSKMDFREGGTWLYAMKGPDGQKSWCRVDYEEIKPYRSFSAVDSFCDENGDAENTLPGMHWYTVFSQTGGRTKVTVEISFTKVEDFEKIMEMGFEEGFKMGLDNLEAFLSVRG